MRKAWLSVLLALCAFVLPARAQDRPPVSDLLAGDADARFGMLLQAVRAAGMTGTLDGLQDATLLAPTNAAFDATLAYLGISWQDLLADPESLARILDDHILPRRLQLRDLSGGPAEPTRAGDSVQFALSGGELTVNGAPISDVDNLAAHGVVVHVIDRVLLPPDMAQAAAANRAHIRVMHLSPDAGPLSVLRDGVPSGLPPLTFGQLSEWVEIPAGERQFALVSGDAPPRAEALSEIAPGAWLTVAAIGLAESDDLRLVLLNEDVTPLAAGEARLSVLHAVQDAPALDVALDGQLLIGGLAYPGTSGGNDGFDSRVVSASTYTLTVSASAGAAAQLLSASVQLAEGYTILIAITGTPQRPQMLVRAFNLALLLPDAPPG
jgi:uncharacterized surface protein with fasciclin (FAS1) repeats